MSRRDTPRRKPITSLIAEPDAPALPFPVDVFPAPLACFVHEVAAALPCPPDFVGVPMLALLGCAIGTSRVLRVKPGWLEGPRLYTAVVADTGTKKSPALRLAAWPFYERQWKLLQPSLPTQGLEAEDDTYVVAPPTGAHTLADKPKQASIATPSADDRSSPPQLYTTDATLEALVVLLAQNPRGIALIQDELAAWVGAMNQYRGGKGADRQRFLSFWNGSPVIVNRKSRKEAIVLENPFVCVAGCLPPEVLPALSDERGRDDGFIYRLLFGCPDHMPVRWTDAGISDHVLHDYGVVCDRLWRLQGHSPGDDSSPLSPTPMTFTRQGRAAFIEFANALYEELADPALPDHLRGPWAKLDGYGARVALILHLCRVVCDEADTDDVGEHSVTAMVQLMEYFKAHAQRVYTRLRSTRSDQRANQACRWIRAAGGSCTVRELQRYRVAGVRRASEADKLVRDLIDLGDEQMMERQLPSGRTQRVFVLHTDEVS